MCETINEVVLTLNALIYFRDHFFDTAKRARKKHKERTFKFSDFNKPARGDLPIRAQYGYKLNETKVLPSKRLGLQIDLPDDNA